ncbi:NF038122 family metalloprotease [filamentous cyanobacterium LEGE 11480]|uniref:NF038122 family metalloprotease n=1 Tax=Romeriopsis navalis LEGE 11480 TaxID=2777977 RepID=A0A928Z419_9CYAN|nr:NF038122 family metalloprotease [Romeriopsis navalis]MBE9031279.1 NF038122 family metalloprotease [Romeriopsis navalis LEGE 11480]
MATQFNFTYGQDITLQQMVGVETAGKIWSSYLQDDVTLNIHVGTSSSLPKDVIGGALPGIQADVDHEDFYNALDADQTTANDATAVQNLRRFSSRVVYDMFIRDDDNFRSSRSIEDVNLTRANAKALNLIGRHDQGLDGVILLGNLAGNSKFNWNYDYSRSGKMGGNDLDYLSTVMHEIGHVLGFVSGVDQPGWIGSRVEIQGDQLTAYRDFLQDRVSYATALDLYRYNIDTSDGWSDIDLAYGSNGGKKYFSIDGETALAEFATGLDQSLGGDGEQASHWKYGTEGLMSPRLKKKQRVMISQLDLTAFDVIGWDVQETTINFQQIHNQTKKALASRLNPNLANNQRLSWMNNALNSPSQTQQYAQQLTQEPTGAINDMIQNSQVYQWGTHGDGYWWGADSDGWWQKVADLFYQRGLFSTISDTDSAPQAAGNQNSGGFNLAIQFEGFGNSGNVSQVIDTVLSMVKQNQSQPAIGDSSNITLTQVETMVIDLVSPSANQFELSTPKAFSHTRKRANKQVDDRHQTEWGIPGDGYWSNL